MISNNISMSRLCSLGLFPCLPPSKGLQSDYTGLRPIDTIMSPIRNTIMK